MVHNNKHISTAEHTVGGDMPQNWEVSRPPMEWDASHPSLPCPPF